MKRFLYFTLAITVGFAITTTGAGCRRKAATETAPAAAKAATKAKVEEEKAVREKVTMPSPGKEGQVAAPSGDAPASPAADAAPQAAGTAPPAAHADIPHGYPKDAPTYPGMEINASTDFSGSGNFGIQVMAADSMDKVAAFYQKELPAQGWTKEQEIIEPGKRATLIYSKDDGKRKLSISALPSGDKSTISINLSGG